MSAEAPADLQALLSNCALGVELHRLAAERVRRLANLWLVGKSMEEVAGTVLHRLCDDDPEDAKQYLQALKDVIAADLDVLFLYVRMETLETKNPKA